ncbi:MAG: signal recognition particle protein, partial [Clostridia bacterium]|nr:signal recognition particle protein [Clostridia bacterium]
EIKRRTNPNEILLVIDAMTGQDAVNVAKSFNEKLEIDGVILTKLDGDTRGGAALAVRHITGKPIKFTGVGEKIDELEPFYPERAASRILGMGDMLSFIEKAEAELDEKQSEEMLARLEKNKFDLNDMLTQFRQVKKMGSIKKLIGMLPGAQDIDENSIDEKAFTRMEAIILSMTPQERSNPALLNASRRRRIAEGSGTNVQQVNKLIKQYEQTKELMKKFTKGGKLGKFRKGGPIPPDWNL